jgi:hypothetical protein
VTEFVITITKQVIFEILVGTFMNDLMMAKAELVCVMVIVVDWAILSEHMPATKNLMMKPTYSSPL